MPASEWEIPTRCRHCGAAERVSPYVTRPGTKNKHDHVQDECACFVTGMLCLNCRMFNPGHKKN